MKFKSIEQEISHYDKTYLIPIRDLNWSSEGLDLTNLPEYEPFGSFPILVKRNRKGRLKVLGGSRIIAAAKAAGFDEVVGCILDEHCSAEVKRLFIENTERCSEHTIKIIGSIEDDSLAIQTIDKEGRVESQMKLVVS